MQRHLSSLTAAIVLLWAPTTAAQAAPLRLDIEHLTVQGPPDKALLQRSLRARRAPLERCLALHPDPDLQEDTLRMVLGRDAQRGVFTALHASTERGGTQVNACLLAVARTLELPRSMEPCGLSQVSLPLRRRVAAATPATP